MEIVLTDENFDQEVKQSDIPVMVDFFATWCGPCQMMMPAVEELATEYEGRVKIGKMNIDEQPNTPESFGVQSIPTLLFVKGGEVVETLVGAQSKDKIQEKLDALLA